MSNNAISRRSFIKAGAAAAISVGATNLVIAKDETEKKKTEGKVVNVGSIGCGGMGKNHLRRSLVPRSKEKGDVKVVALCDVYEKRKKEALEIAEGATIYHDYKNLLNHKGLDAVVIATPDHWHAQIAIDAMKKGKDVYVEKPMTQTIEEAKELVKTQQKTKRIVQVGGSGPSSDSVWKARKLIEEGLIGKVVWSQAGRSRNTLEGEWNYRIDEGAESQIDWERWLGPAPKHPFDPDRYFRWRKYWDYGTGLIGDLYYHSLCPLVLMTSSEFPIRVCGSGGMFYNWKRETPDTFTMVVDYPDNHYILLTGSMANSYPIPQIVHGHRGTLQVDGKNIAIYPEDIFANEYDVDFKDKKLTVEKMLVPVREGYRRRNPGHGGWLSTPEEEIPEPKRDSLMDNFINCVHSREEPYYPARLGYMIQVAITLAVKSYRENKVYRFDPETEKII